MRWVGPRTIAALSILAVLACSDEEGGPGVYPARGTVEDVDVSGAQVLIDHEDVPGLMPAMTMNFAVPDDAVLSRLSSGQVIEFSLRFTGRSYEVEAFEVVGEAPYDEGWRRLGDALVRTSAAPPFELLDQSGRTVDQDDFADRIWLVDFVYTECPGPCPIQTAALVALQRALPDEVRDRIHFLSFSLDPEVDRPEVFEAYATARGADLERWSFLTGERAPLEALVREWGVGSLRQPDGTIDHTLILFVVKDGRVMERYTLGDARDGVLLDALVTLAKAPADAGDGTPMAPSMDGRASSPVPREGHSGHGMHGG